MRVVREFTKKVKLDGRYVTEIWRQIDQCPAEKRCNEECIKTCPMDRWEVERRVLHPRRCPEAVDPTLMFDYRAMPPQDYSDMLNMLDLLLQ
jgi:hypothetical protein